jgi:hypothetical protein
MRTCLAFLLLCLFAMPVLAAEKLVLATCGEKGCRCDLTSVTAEEATVFLGIDPPPPGKGEVKLVDYNGEMMWSRLPLREINIVAGGNDECPLHLFQEETMVPLDGLWVGTAKPAASKGCPPGLDAMLAPTVKNIVLSRPIRWAGSFHPDKMQGETAGQAIRWSQVTPRSFRGEPANLQTATSSANIAMEFQAALVSPNIVRGLVRMQLRSKGGPGSEQALKMAGLANCRAVIRYEFRRQGP